jgi:hypothetical protein
MATTIAKKVTKGNHTPGTGDGRFRVYSKQFNELVDVILQLEGTDGVLTPTTITASGSITITGSTVASGYATGAGGAVTQATNRSTGVTLSKPCGVITTHNASLAAAAEVTFTVTNTLVASTDTVIVSNASTTTGTPFAFVSDVSDGSFDITLTNMHASTADTSADVINFAVIKAVNA